MTPGMEKTWSTQQKDIFDFFADGRGNLVVRARAGTGKTTTIIEAVRRPAGAVVDRCCSRCWNLRWLTPGEEAELMRPPYYCAHCRKRPLFLCLDCKALVCEDHRWIACTRGHYHNHPHHKE